METVVINLYGGPCAGKSTIAAGLYFEMKCLGIDCEFASEVAKDKVWDDNPKALSDQPYIFGNQLHRINRLNGKVKYVICDSPIILSMVYSAESNKETKTIFDKFVLSEHKKFNNANFFISRNTYDNKFVQNGRVHTEKQSIQKDDEILNVLKENNIEYNYITDENSKSIVNHILILLGIKK